VTIEGVIDADPDVRDTCINPRGNADRLTSQLDHIARFSTR